MMEEVAVFISRRLNILKRSEYDGERTEINVIMPPNFERLKIVRIGKGYRREGGPISRRHGDEPIDK